MYPSCDHQAIAVVATSSSIDWHGIVSPAGVLFFADRTDVFRFHYFFEVFICHIFNLLLPVWDGSRIFHPSVLHSFYVPQTLR
jgi:hypothetical protein